MAGVGMANEEHLEILKSGSEVWNRWRRENPGSTIDLRGAYLPGADLGNANLEGVSLQHAKLQNSNLRMARLQDSKAWEAHLQGTDLQGANLREANLLGAELSGADLQGADLHGSSFESAGLQKANLQRADLGSANFQYADLEGAVLAKAKLQRTDFGGANFQGASLQEADFQGAKLQGVDFQEADLHGAILNKTLLVSVLNLVQAKNLETCWHWEPSSLDQLTLELAQGQLPRTFLKGCGLTNWEILNARLHDPNLRADEVTDIGYEIINLRTKGPIQVNSLFISYSREDAAFMEFIEKKLDADGIRSWRDVHHMTAGPVEQQIEQAIDLNGTVLLVLSENSLGSRWVEWEVERADERQRESLKQGKNTHVLCPIDIDGTWEKAKWPGPLMNQIKKYHILDYSKWEEGRGVEDEYSKLRAGIARYYSS